MHRHGLPDAIWVALGLLPARLSTSLALEDAPLLVTVCGVMPASCVSTTRIVHSRCCRCRSSGLRVLFPLQRFNSKVSELTVTGVLALPPHRQVLLAERQYREARELLQAALDVCGKR